MAESIEETLKRLGWDGSRKIYLNQVWTDWGPYIFMPSYDGMLYRVERVEIVHRVYQGPGSKRIHKRF